MKKVILAEIISVLFVMLFTYAGFSKLLSYQSFAIQLGQSPLLVPFAKWLAWTLPITEIILSILLFTNRFRLISLYASFCLMVLFTIYIIVLMNYSYYIPCTCGGILKHMSWKIHLLFNIVFVLLAVAGIFALKSEEHNLFYCNKTVVSEKL
jgi:uncharacterized membrane protein YphA (DoxX/SURF4 family)